MLQIWKKITEKHIVYKLMIALLKSEVWDC